MKETELVRSRFEQINAAFVGYSNGQKHAEPSKLRIETPLKPGQGRYEFNIKKQDIDNAFEKALDRNDVFIPNYIGLLLALRPTTNPMTEVLYSFPIINDGTNASAYPAGFTTKDAEAIYNGALEWCIDNGVMISAYPTENFKKVPAEVGKFMLDASGASVATVVERDCPQWNIKDACEFVIPKLVIAGSRDHKLTINFNASGLNFAVTSGYTAHLVLYMDGTLVKGGCEYLDKNNPYAQAVGSWGN